MDATAFDRLKLCFILESQILPNAQMVGGKSTALVLCKNVFKSLSEFHMKHQKTELVK